MPIRKPYVVEPVIPSFRSPSPDQPAASGGPATPTPAERLAEHQARIQTTEAVEQVARRTAHALNNYLMVFAGGLDIILGALDSDPARVRKMLANMQEAAEGAGELADNLQAMRGPDGSSPETLDLREFASQALPQLRTLVGPDVKLVLEAPDDSALVCIDPTRFQSALVELVKNANEAMPEGGILRLRVRKGRVDANEAQADLPVGHYVMLDVEDNGKGMSAEIRAHAFHPFYNPAKNPDRGWGLTKVWGIVRQAKGTLWLDSVENQGTTVTIHLPSAEVHPKPGAQIQREEPRTVNGQTILLVDDESPVRALVTDVLVDAGYEVLPAANGDEALEIARHHPGGIDLLLADLIMPGLNGREVAEHFSKLRPDSKVLFMSGYPADVLRRVSGGVPAPFLSKPFSPAELRVSVEQVLSRLAG